MSRESAFSTFDNNQYNASVNDFFGGLGRVTNPIELAKENEERNEFNERLLDATGAISGPLIDQGLHGVSHELFKGVKTLIGKGGKTVAQQLGITPAKFAEYSKKYGLSEETLDDLARGKINLTKLAKGGIKAAFEQLGNKANIPTNLTREGGNVLAQGKSAVDSAIKSVHSGLATGLADTDLTDLGSLPLAKSVDSQRKALKDVRRQARRAVMKADAAADAARRQASRLAMVAAQERTPEAQQAAEEAQRKFRELDDERTQKVNSYSNILKAGKAKATEKNMSAARDLVGDARAGLADALKERYGGGGDRDVAQLARLANVNRGKLLDANTSPRHAVTKAPIQIEMADPFQTQVLPNDIQKKVDVNPLARNDGLSAVEEPEQFSFGKQGSMSVVNKKQALREARRMAKTVQQTGETFTGEALEEKTKALARRANRAFGRVQPPDLEPTKVAKTEDYKITTSSPFSIRVFDNPQAKAERDSYMKQAALQESRDNLAQKLQDYEASRPQGPPKLPDPLEGVRSGLSEQQKSILPDISELAQAKPVEGVGLPSIQQREKIPTGPLRQTDKGFVNQQLQFLEASGIGGKPTTAPEAPNVTKTNILSQKEPDAPLTDEGESIGGTAGGLIGAGLAAAQPGQTTQQRAQSAAEALSGTVAEEGASALGATEAVAGAAGLIPGAIVAATEKGTAAQRAARVGQTVGEGVAPQAAGALVKATLSTAAEDEGGDVASTASNLATKAAASGAEAAATQTAEKEGENIVEKALATAGEGEVAGGGPEDIVGDIVSLGLGIGTLVGGLEGIKKQEQPVFRRPINPSVTYGI